MYTFRATNNDENKKGGYEIQYNALQSKRERERDSWISDGFN